MRRVSSKAGFTLIAVILAVFVMGIGLEGVSQSWRIRVQREKEEELLWRGRAIKWAIEQYYRNSPGGRTEYPQTLSDLLQDPRYPTVRRYLRRPYLDPITDSRWGYKLNAQERITGVYSTSKKRPLKTSFPEAFKGFEGKKKYKQWVFEFSPVPTPVAPGGIAPKASPTEANDSLESDED